MKVDAFYGLIIILLSALLSWGEFYLVKADNLQWIAAITTFISLTVSGLFSIAVKAQTERCSTLIGTTGGIFLFILLVVNFTFAFFEFSIPLYIIINALLLLVMITIIRFISIHAV